MKVRGSILRPQDVVAALYFLGTDSINLDMSTLALGDGVNLTLRERSNSIGKPWNS
jgi:hypothetical protein